MKNSDIIKGYWIKRESEKSTSDLDLLRIKKCKETFEDLNLKDIKGTRSAYRFLFFPFTAIIAYAIYTNFDYGLMCVIAYILYVIAILEADHYILIRTVQLDVQKTRELAEEFSAQNHLDLLDKIEVLEKRLAELEDK